MENCSSVDDSSFISELELEESVFGPEFESDNRPSTPTEIIEAAIGVRKNLLPQKSSMRYQQEWKKSKGAVSNSERTLMAYFGELEKKFASSTLWSKYSMLRATMVIHDAVDISKYAFLSAMLKKYSKDYVPKQAKTFTEAELQRFMDTAPDVAWLDVKVVCAFGLSGACRTHELPSIRMEDISRYADMYYVVVPRENTKTRNNDNSFAITGTLLDYVVRYEKLRPSHTTTNRFFINYQKGKCTVQTIGKSKFYKMPGRIAEFLNLPNPELYTGHSIRRSSATFYANTGATVEALKRHTGHKSTNNSLEYKRKTGKAIESSINCSSTSISGSSIAMSTKRTEATCGNGPLNNGMFIIDQDNPSRAATGAPSTFRTFRTSPSNGPLDNGMSIIDQDDPSRAAEMSNSHDELRSATGSRKIDKSSITVPSDMYCDELVTASAADSGTHREPLSDITTNQQKRKRNIATTNNDTIDENADLMDAGIMSQSFSVVGQLEKRFAFYKCENLTITFGK